MLKAISTRSQLKVNRTRPRQFLYTKMNPFGYQYLLAKRRGIILRAMISHHQKKRRPRNVYQRALTSSRATDGEFNRIIPILREKDDVKHFQYFRMGKDQFDAIHDRIQQVIERGPNHAIPISTRERLSFTLMVRDIFADFWIGGYLICCDCLIAGTWHVWVQTGLLLKPCMTFGTRLAQNQNFLFGPIQWDKVGQGLVPPHWPMPFILLGPMPVVTGGNPLRLGQGFEPSHTPGPRLSHFSWPCPTLSGTLNHTLAVIIFAIDENFLS